MLRNLRRAMLLLDSNEDQSRPHRLQLALWVFLGLVRQPNAYGPRHSVPEPQRGGHSDGHVLHLGQSRPFDRQPHRRSYRNTPWVSLGPGIRRHRDRARRYIVGCGTSIQSRLETQGASVSLKEEEHRHIFYLRYCSLPPLKDNEVKFSGIIKS